jgi:hypothetical protein
MVEAFFLAQGNERSYRTLCATKPQTRRGVVRYVEGFFNSRPGTPRAVPAGERSPPLF